MSPVKNEFGLYEVEIDGKKYTFEKWGAEESLSILLKIAKIVGKPLGIFVSEVIKSEDNDKKKMLDKNINPEIFTLIFEAITANLDETVCMALIKKFSSEKVFCEGAKISFNSHYEDRLDLAFRVMNAGLSVQYGNFFSALLGVLPVKGAVKSQIQGIMNR